MTAPRDKSSRSASLARTGQGTESEGIHPFSGSGRARMNNLRQWRTATIRNGYKPNYLHHGTNALVLHTHLLKEPEPHKK